ncbi:hypothetical protein [Streptomyces glaucosporus]
MRNAVKCALAGGCLLTAGVLGPLYGAALAAPAPSAPRVLVLAEAPHRPDGGQASPRGAALPSPAAHGGPVVVAAGGGRRGHSPDGDRPEPPERGSGSGVVPAS